MNSRIQELIDQSSTMSWEVDHAVTTVDAYALAELIVRECASVAFKNVCYGNGEVGPESDILDHFGVE